MPELPDARESEDECAAREVHEETDVKASIMERIPGEFAGGTTVNIYFLMRFETQDSSSDSETANVRGATFEEAEDLVSQMTNTTGRKRGLGVLAAARKCWKHNMPAQHE